MDQPYDRTIRYLWNHELSKLNAHIPARRIPLNEMLEMSKPSFPLRDGTYSVIPRNELLNLANYVPPEYHSRLSLPFVFLRRLDLDRGTYTILGSIFEKFCVERLIGIKVANSTPWSLFASYKPRQCVYAYQIYQFRKQFRNVSTIAITTMSNSSKNQMNNESLQKFQPTSNP